MNEEKTIYYLCDKKACKDQNRSCMRYKYSTTGCRHTSQIEHAKNFELSIGGIHYREKHSLAFRAAEKAEMLIRRTRSEIDWRYKKIKNGAKEMKIRNGKNIIGIKLNVRCENLKNLGRIIEIVTEQTKEHPHAKIKMNITRR